MLSSTVHPQPPRPSRVRAHLIQLDIRWENKPANYARAAELIHEARPEPGDLVILPEMFDTGFSCNLSSTADADGHTLAFLRSVATRHQITVHGQRSVLGPDARGRNRASIINPAGAVICEYDKAHLFPLGAPTESEHFSPGQTPTTYTWMQTDARSVAVVCPTICYDLRFPELFRQGLALGAELFVVSSSWPRPREEHRRILSIARAIENQAFVLSVNRCGSDPALDYAGGSLAVSPRGEVLGSLDDREGVLSVEIDMNDLRSWRAVFPAWREATTGDAPRAS